MDDFALTPDIMLNAYANGVFPMADGADEDDLFWVDPQKRGVFPLDSFHLSRSTRKDMRNRQVHATINSKFEKVVDHCADREETWINEPLHNLYQSLNVMGYAHSVEVWQGDRLLGAVFGLTIGTAYFGESMVSLERNGSKMALTFLVDHLRQSGFKLFDTQFITDHLASLGAVEISRAAYRRQLAEAIKGNADFNAQAPAPLYDVLQRMTQTS